VKTLFCSHRAQWHYYLASGHVKELLGIFLRSSPCHGKWPVTEKTSVLGGKDSGNPVIGFIAQWPGSAVRGKSFTRLRRRGNYMSQKKSTFGALVLSVLLLVASGSVFAQATRTWVSGVGDDANPCSRTAPCKTWAGAISKTAASGIINCIDAGAYGAVTITKSITISCEDVEAAALASSTNGVVISGAGIDVVLRGLYIDGSPITSPGLNGIRFLQGASLIVEDCNIRDFKGLAPNGSGIVIANTSLVAKVDIINSHVTGNGAGTYGAGINIAPTGTGSARVTIANSKFHNNVVGIRASAAGTTGSIGISVTDTTSAGSTLHGIVAESASGAVRMMLNHVVVTNNSSDGLRSVGANSTIRIGNSVVTGNNGTGFAVASGGVLQSYGNNQVNSNGLDGTATPVAFK
jgi:parallel beta helix pectate lyase-like protein